MLKKSNKNNQYNKTNARKEEVEVNNWNKKAATRSALWKETVFLKVLQNSQENTCVGVSFLQFH